MPIALKPNILQQRCIIYAECQTSRGTWTFWNAHEDKQVGDNISNGGTSWPIWKQPCKWDYF